MKTLRRNTGSPDHRQPRGMPLARGDLQNQLAGDKILRSWIAGLMRENCHINGFQGSGPSPRGSRPPTRDPVDRGSPSLTRGRARESISRTTYWQGGLTFQYRHEFDIGGRGSTPPTRDVADRGYFFPSRGDPPWHTLRCWADIDCKPAGNIGGLLVGSTPPLQNNRGRESISLTRKEVWISSLTGMEFDVGNEGSSPPMGNDRGRESISLSRGAPCRSAPMEAESYSCITVEVDNNNRLRASSTGVAVEEFSPNGCSIRLNFGTPSLSWSVVGWGSLSYTNDITASGGELVNRLRFS